jgi:hypothetical protein
MMISAWSKERINQEQTDSLPIVLPGGCSADQQLVASNVLLKQATCPHFSYSFPTAVEPFAIAITK